MQMLRLSCLPSLMDGVLLVILRMRPASPKSTVSGHREIIIIIVRETIAIRGGKRYSEGCSVRGNTK
jgi:hypothetical protein